MQPVHMVIWYSVIKTNGSPKLGAVVHADNPGTQMVEAGGLGVQGSLGYVRPQFKKPKDKKRKKG